jgi:hypothetical protein
VVFLGLLFPNGRLPGARWRWFARLSAFLTLVAMVLAAFSPGQIVVGLTGIRNPLGIERLQTKWFTCATAVAAGDAILKYVISEPLALVWLGWAGKALVLVGLAGIPVSMGIAITRYRLYEIDILINRTLV